MKKLLRFLVLVLLMFAVVATVQYLQVDVNDWIDSDETTVVETTMLDETAPVITVGSSNELYYSVNGGDVIDWTTYITAVDDVDGNITIVESMVDSSAFDQTVIGTYNIVFTVTDSSGNSATETISVEVGAE